MPTLSTHVPEDWEFTERFNSRIGSKDYRGKPGPYLRDLIESDLMAGPEGSQLGFTKAQIDQWQEDELTLLHAATLARRALYAEVSEEERQRLLRELANRLLDASFRRPSKKAEFIPMAAEPQGSYSAHGSVATLRNEEREVAARKFQEGKAQVAASLKAPHPPKPSAPKSSSTKAQK